MADTVVVQYSDALASSLEYFSGDQIAADVFVGKYALRNGKGELLEHTPTEMHWRLAREFARIEQKYANPMSEEEIFGLLDHFRYVVPQGSPMSAIGNHFKLQSLSNCFVISQPEDSYGGILYTDQEQAQIMKRRGGVGFDISTIRPKGMSTANAAGSTDGIGVFMERFSNTCREVAQGGRRGALMITIDVSHYEVETFIKIKRDEKKVTGANISLRLSDKFMRAARDDKDFQLHWPVGVPDPAISKMVRARELWDMIIDSAWSMAEPGLLFWDTVIRNTPADIFTPEGFGSISTNPCSELMLCADDSCRLMLLNVLSYVMKQFTKDAHLDEKKFYDHIMKVQRLMDDLVDLELEAVDRIIAKIQSDENSEAVKRIEIDLWKRIKLKAEQGRRTGLGITALGDALAALGLTYGSPESIEITEKVYKILALAAHESSVRMAAERGSFPVCDPQRMVDHPFISRLIESSSPEVNGLFMQYGRRNIALTTTAPAGSVSTLTQTTSGIEPAFLLKYTRRRKVNPNDEASRIDFIDDMGDKWQEYPVYHHGFKKWMDVTGKTYDDVAESPYYKATSNDVDWAASVDILAAAQKYVEHGISKTINLPSDAKRELVAHVYMRAWENNCKGITVYRDGCREGVLIKETKQSSRSEQRCAPKRPDVLDCRIHHAQIKGEMWTILVGLLDGKPYEVFGGHSKHIEIPKKINEGLIVKHDKKSSNSVYDLRIGNDAEFIIKDIATVFDNPNYSHTTRLISLALRHGAKIQYVVEQLQKERDADMFSFVKCIARVLKQYIEDGSTTTVLKECPNCKASNGGSNFIYQEGCVKCIHCSWSRCS